VEQHLHACPQRFWRIWYSTCHSCLSMCCHNLLSCWSNTSMGMCALHTSTFKAAMASYSSSADFTFHHHSIQTHPS
jgi:hypothetical protein